MRQLRCPNCGGEHTLVNPGITMVVCEFCKTVVYWDADTVLKMGSQSILPAQDTRLFLRASGTLLGQGFEVVGHLRYDHGLGSWDEWYLQLDDGRVAWLSEDERELSLEQAARLAGEPPPADKLRPGQLVTIEGDGYSVREVGVATCLGGEGQLPFTVLPGESYPYADLATNDGVRFATLEYEQGGRPRAYTGQVLGHEQLSIADERPPSTAGGTEGKQISCPNCAAPITFSGGREVQTLVCEYCGAQNDLTGAEAKVLGLNPPDLDAAFFFDIGQTGTFLGKPHEICGRLLYEDYEGYQTREYLLFNPESGYLWLAEEQGHFVLNRPTQQAPHPDPMRLTPKKWAKAGNTRFQLYEIGAQRLRYVDGALPWLAKTGDSTRYADLIAPPHMLSVEQSESEVEYFYGSYLPAVEVWQAFGLKDRPPSAFGVHPAQPFSRGPLAKMLMRVGGLFAAINLVLLLWSISQDSRLLLEQTFSSESYLKETISRSFTVGQEAVMALQIFAPLSNSWMALDVALLDEQDRVVEEVDGEIGYYFGVEGGESWSEGSTRTTSYFKRPPPGQYRLILKAAAGTGERGPPGGEPLTLRVAQGAILSRYFLAAFIFALLFPLLGFTRQALFEKRRWAPVMDDDDDDDD